MECHSTRLRHVRLEHLHGHHPVLCLLDLVVRLRLPHSAPLLNCTSAVEGAQAASKVQLCLLEKQAGKHSDHVAEL